MSYLPATFSQIDNRRHIGAQWDGAALDVWSTPQSEYGAFAVRLTGQPARDLVEDLAANYDDDANAILDQWIADSRARARRSQWQNDSL